MRKSLFVLLTILILAAALRIYRLDTVPPSLFGDEVDVGYQAYSLLKSGKDLYGNSWPTLLHSLSEYRAPLFIYSDIPFIAIFGLNEWGVRLAAAFWGIVGILGIYLLTRKLFNEKIGLLAATFLTISPWHIHYSRAGFEVTMLISFLMFAVYFFIKGLEKKYFLLLSLILFGLTPYIYSTAIVFMPLMLLILIISFGDVVKNKKTNFAIAICTLILILIPYALQTISGKSGERFSVISVFGNKDTIARVQFLQQQEQLPLNFQRFFHNKVLEWGKGISMNYLRAFSPEFLFLNGDPNSRHSVHEMGQMYFFELFLLVLGIWWMFGSGTTLFSVKIKWLVIGWLFIAPIPASLTYDGGFHATRDFLMLPPLMIILAFGINHLLEIRPGKYIAGVLAILIALNMIFYLHRYFIHYPVEQWRAWHFGFKEAMQYVKQNRSYDKVFINNTYEPSLIRFLFWNEYDPNKLHHEFVTDHPDITMPGFVGFRLEKYYFGKFTGPFEQLAEPQSLYVTSARDDITNPEILHDKKINLLKTIYSPTGEPIFHIFSGK